MGDVAAGAARVMAFFGIAFLVTALFVYAYTRSLRFTVVPLACSLVAVVWQLGAVTGLGFGIDPMSILVPFLVFAIGVSHGVQMVSAVRAEVIGGASAPDAARASFRRLLLPGSVALVSDSVGFITISLIEVRVIQEIAITASVGVAAIILTNLALLPVLLSYLEVGEEERRAAGDLDRRLRPLWSRVARVARRRPGPGGDRHGGGAGRGRSPPCDPGPGGRRAARRAGAAPGLRVQPRHRRHRRTLRDRGGRAHGDRGDGGPRAASTTR